MAWGTGLDFEFRILVFELRKTVAKFAIPKQVFVFGQLDVSASGPVTRFATHVNFRKGRVIHAPLGIKVLLQVR